MSDLVKRLRAADYWMRGEEGLGFEDDAPFAAADLIEALEAKNDQLREALNQSRLAFAGYVSVQSAINLIDRAALGENS